MSIGTPVKSREGLSRSAARNKSYVDLTAGSESEAESERAGKPIEDQKPLRNCQREASSSKRKRVSMTCYKLEAQPGEHAGVLM